MTQSSPYLRRPTRSLGEYRDALVVELGEVPVTCGRAAELARLIREADDEIVARNFPMSVGHRSASGGTQG